MTEQSSPNHHADLPSLRERMWTLGAEALSTSELLALVLGTGHSSNALELAEHLYAAYGGLLGIARLGLAELSEAQDVGLAKAVQLRAALYLGERLKQEIVLRERPQIKTPADAAALCMPEMSGLEQEHLRAVLLDTRNRVMSIQEIYRGSQNCIIIHPPDIFREAIRRSCASLIVAHNHPSGDPSPSGEDIRSTRMLIKAGKVIEIDLLDHLIIGHGAYVSLKERGLGFD